MQFKLPARYANDFLLGSVIFGVFPGDPRGCGRLLLFRREKELEPKELQLPKNQQPREAQNYHGSLVPVIAFCWACVVTVAQLERCKIRARLSGFSLTAPVSTLPASHFSK